MGWPAAIGVGLLTGITGLLLAGYVANLAADWHRMSSFEGASGYFVVAMALLGLLGGLLLGIVVARLVTAGANPGFLRALGIAQPGAVLVIGAIGAIARLTADVPPTLGGEALALAVEFRWPAAEAPAVAPDASIWSVQLIALDGRGQRQNQDGPLWHEDARTEEGYWIVPGAVGLFTERSARLLGILPTTVTDQAFRMPLQRHPGRKDLAWSEWLPRDRDGAAPPGGISFRYRVVPAAEPLRTEAVDPFQVVTHASAFAGDSGSAGDLAVLHRGQPVHIDLGDGQPPVARAAAVALLPGAAPALLVLAGRTPIEAWCFLVQETGADLAISRIARCADPIVTTPLTNDARLFAATPAPGPARSGIDRSRFPATGQYLIGDMVLDTGTRTVRRVPDAADHQLISRIPPLAVAPDGNSFVRLGYGAAPDSVALHVLPLDGRAPYQLPVDRNRMRFADWEQLTPDWVVHHFDWAHDSTGDRLSERPGFAPLPWRGTLTLDSTGYREYRVAPARPGLRDALAGFLVAEFQAERRQAEAGAFAHELSIGTTVVNLGYRAEDDHVSAWIDRGKDSSLVATIAGRFDAALATGRYDEWLGE